MDTRLLPLLSVVTEHAYFGSGAADVLRWQVPPATARTLAGWRVRVRCTPGRFELWAEADQAGQRMAPADALVSRPLHFGLQPAEATLETITAPLGTGTGLRPWWHSTAEPGVLAGPQGLRLSGQRLRVDASLAARPLTLRLLTDQGTERAVQVLAEGVDGFTWPVAWPEGLWLAEARAGADLHQQPVLVDDALASAPTWGVLSLTLTAADLATPPRYTLRLDARSDTLRYYVVAQRYSQADFDALRVQDAGAVADARPALEFDRIDAADFGPAHLSPGLLDAAGTARVALFQSRQPALRRQRGLRGIELQRHGDVVLNHLPAPGPGRADAPFVVHLNQT